MLRECVSNISFSKVLPLVEILSVLGILCMPASREVICPSPPIFTMALTGRQCAGFKSSSNNKKVKRWGVVRER